MEGGMNVAFSAISNALFWQIPTKQPSLVDQATSNPLLPPRPPKKNIRAISVMPTDRVRWLGDKVMMLLRHESN